MKQTTCRVLGWWAMVVVLWAVLDGRARAQRPAARTNVVLILADDVGWGDVGFNVSKSWRTPHLDRLASQGLVLKRFYAGAVVCAPSRGVLLTGKYTIHNGVRYNDEDLPAEQVTIAEALKQHGYTTALFGKWHHGKPRDGYKTYVHPMDQGFDRFFGFTNATHAHEKFPKELWDGRATKPAMGYADDLFVARALEFLKEQEVSRTPFFLYLSLTSAHFRIEAPDDEVALHRGKFQEASPDKPLNATYAAMITRFDKHVGQIMESLDSLGLSNDTLVLVTSDHGATFEKGNEGTSAYHDSNFPLRGQKRTLWEGGIRVRAIVRWTGHVPPGSVSHTPMHMADVLPTILSAVGHPADRSSGLDGVDLLPAWLGKAAVQERTLFWEWRGEGYDQVAAMRGRWKLVVTRGGRPELFDVERDEAERRDISAIHPEEAKRLQAELNAWLATERSR